MSKTIKVKSSIKYTPYTKKNNACTPTNQSLHTPIKTREEIEAHNELQIFLQQERRHAEHKARQQIEQQIQQQLDDEWPEFKIQKTDSVYSYELNQLNLVDSDADDYDTEDEHDYDYDDDNESIS